MNRSVYIGLLLMAGLTLLQASLLSRFPFLGLAPMISLLAALAWSLHRGPFDGVLWAFIAGLFLDLFSISPLGSTSLALMVAVLVISWARQSLPEGPFVVPVLLVGAGLGVYLLLYMLILWLTGYGFQEQLLVRLVPVVLLHTALALPVHWLLSRLDRALFPRPIAS